MANSTSSNTPDTATPLNSAGTPTQAYGNAAGGFDLETKLGPRKAKSRKDSDQPKGSPLKVESSEQDDDATRRYFGDFSIEAKRNVMDLLKTHPMYAKKRGVNMGRVENNTREENIMPNDPTKLPQNGGYIAYENQPKASQTKY